MICLYWYSSVKLASLWITRVLFTALHLVLISNKWRSLAALVTARRAWFSIFGIFTVNIPNSKFPNSLKLVQYWKNIEMSDLSVVLGNSDLLLYIMSFIDPQYSEFHNKSDGMCDYANYFVRLQTFRCLWNNKYIHKCTNMLKIKSLRNNYVISLSLCKWSIGMGITNNCDYSFCSLVYLKIYLFWRK